MATNEIQGDVVGLWISTNTTTPAYLEVVCAENTGVDGSRDVNSKRTKCGVIKGFGPASWTITGSGAANSSPTGTQMSAEELIAAFQSETDILVKLEHATDDAIYYRQGRGQITSYAETGNTGDLVTFDFTIDISGDLVVTAPA